jgi:hypothetical protein
MQQVWVVGQVTDYEHGGWELQGVFSSEEAALAACRGLNDFVGPVPVDIELPRETCGWPGARYPLQQSDGHD